NLLKAFMFQAIAILGLWLFIYVVFHFIWHISLATMVVSGETSHGNMFFSSTYATSASKNGTNTMKTTYHVQSDILLSQHENIPLITGEMIHGNHQSNTLFWTDKWLNGQSLQHRLMMVSLLAQQPLGHGGGFGRVGLLEIFLAGDDAAAGAEEVPADGSGAVIAFRIDWGSKRLRRYRADDTLAIGEYDGPGKTFDGDGSSHPGEDNITDIYKHHYPLWPELLFKFGINTYNLLRAFMFQAIAMVILWLFIYVVFHFIWHISSWEYVFFPPLQRIA
ncbi:hypothetical protein ACJX0J_040294, partial [Zea mays]